MKTKKGLIAEILCYLFKYSWNFLQQIIIYHLRIYRRNYILVHPVLFTKSFGWYGNKEVNYSRNYIISYTLLTAVPSEYCYLSTECIYHKFYGTSSCVIYKIYWLGRQQGRYLYQTLYVRFSTIRGSPFSRLLFINIRYIEDILY